MAFTHKLTKTWTGNDGRTIAGNNSYTGGAQASISESIPDSSTDKLVTFSLDVSTLQAIFILSDQDMTLETNSGSSPTDTINLKAGVPYVWHLADYFTNLITADITANIFLTNASGSAALLQIEMVTDPTP